MDIRIDGPVLVFSGAFDGRCTSEARYAIYRHMEIHPDGVILDISDVPVIDVIALRLLAVATRHAWLTGHQLVLRNPAPSVRRMLHLSRLAHAVDVERVAATA
ncbi:MAG: STAS domain-containing protein [Nocardioides sp.]|nr:STAS domain-containing protein [Nocardioides sp.]